MQKLWGCRAYTSGCVSLKHFQTSCVKPVDWIQKVKEVHLPITTASMVRLELRSPAGGKKVLSFVFLSLFCVRYDFEWSSYMLTVSPLSRLNSETVLKALDNGKICSFILTLNFNVSVPLGGDTT